MKKCIFIIAVIAGLSSYAQPGNPSVFGNGTWNVYCYSGNNFNTYDGFYTESNLSFDSRNRWGSTSTPSNASGYAGNVIGVNQHSLSHKRTGFTCGDYQIDIANHDDYAYLIIDGVQVWSHLGCCDSHTNVWTGFLGGSSTVEFRTREFGGGSHGGLTFTQINSTPSFNITESYDCVSGTDTLTAVGATSVTWSPATGLNTTSGNIVVATATTATTYTATGTSDCNGSITSRMITVQPSHLNLNPTNDFGDNEWYVFCYNGNNFNNYQGYYVQNTTSFDTRSRWGSNNAPSDASNYFGCTVNINQHSYSHKRRGFPCGDFQIDINNHDDYAALLVNGVQVWNHDGCCDSHTNAWTGYLDGSSTVEFRIREFGGGSHGGLNITQLNSNVSLNIVESYNCGAGNDTLRVLGATGVTWSPATGLNTTSGNEVIASPTVTTTYTANGVSDCDGSAVQNTVTVRPSHLATSPTTDYGNNEWLVICYDGNNFNNYMGYYTEPNMLFDTRDRWGQFGTPSDASGYMGCPIAVDQHSYAYKQSGFSCGTYQINVTDHDDYSSLLINGVQVWSHNGCCDNHTNVWSGTLEGNSTVEFRTREFGGRSYASLEFLSAALNNVSTWNGGNTNWFDASNWDNGIPNSSRSAVIPAGLINYPNINASASCYDINIANNAGLTISGNNTLTISGNWTNQGIFTENNSTLIFNGTCNVNTIQNVAAEDFYNITVNSANNLDVTGGELNIRGTLQLSNGSFNTNNRVTLLSDASRTANIGQITGGTISGTITAQRYIDAGATNWRFLTSPVQGTILEDWDDDFLTSGFTGTDYPTFPFASLQFYDETVAGGRENGFLIPSNTSEAIGVGRGVWVWSGDTSTGTQPFTIDVTGQPYTGTINLPVSYTNTGSATGDGWSMVGNPYASVIDWDAGGWTKTNVNGAIYIWNPDLQQYASYVSGVGTNGGSRYIASSQAFWVVGNATIPMTSPVLQITESCKVNNDQAFLKQKANPFKLIRIILSDSLNMDESILRFDASGTSGFDPSLDAFKLTSNNPNAPYLALLNDTSDFSVNTVPDQSEEFSTLLRAKTNTPGTYNIGIKQENLLLGSCIILEDLENNVRIPLENGSTYSFFLSDTAEAPRFKIHAWIKSPNAFDDILCYNDSNSKIVATATGVGPWEFKWSSSNGTTKSHSSNFRNDTLFNVSAGNYIVEISDQAEWCSTHADTISIAQPGNISVDFEIEHATENSKGKIYATITGGTPPYRISWSSDGELANPFHLEPGAYTISVLDKNGCIYEDQLSIIDLTVAKSIDNNFAVYPNPANETLYIQLSENLTGAEISLVNQLGQSFLFVKNASGKNIQLNVEEFPIGVYFLKVRKEGITKVEKVIVN